MLTRPFERSNALGRHAVGPFVEERARFLQHNSEQGMSRSSLRHAAEYLLGAESYLRLGDNPGKRFTLDGRAATSAGVNVQHVQHAGVRSAESNPGRLRVQDSNGSYEPAHHADGVEAVLVRYGRRSRP